MKCRHWAPLKPLFADLSVEGIRWRSLGESNPCFSRERAEQQEEFAAGVVAGIKSRVLGPGGKVRALAIKD